MPDITKQAKTLLWGPTVCGCVRRVSVAVDGGGDASMDQGLVDLDSN